MHLGVDVISIGLGNLLYCLGFLFAIFYLLRTRHHPRWVLYALIAGGYAIQTFGMYQRGLLVGGCPMGNTFEIVQFVIWSLTFCFLVLGPAFRLSLFGFSTAGLAVLLAILSFAIPSWDAPYTGRPFGPSPWIEFHASLALFSYGIFGLLAMSCLLYLLQNFSLRERRLEGFYLFLPSLVETETLSVRMLVAGCSVLTVSLAVGSIYWIQNPATVDWLKLLFTVSVWLAYLLVLVLRLGNRLYSKNLAWTCLALFLVAVISLWPVNQSRAKPESALSESSLGLPHG